MGKTLLAKAVDNFWAIKLSMLVSIILLFSQHRLLCTFEDGVGVALFYAFGLARVMWGGE